MNSRRPIHLVARHVRAVVALALTLALPTAVMAAPPANDSHPGITIASLPFTHSTDTTEATIHALEETPGCALGSTHHSVWYNFTPSADIDVVADTFGSDYDTVVDVFINTLTDVYLDPGFHDLVVVGCNDNSGAGLQSQVAFAAAAGEPYLIRVMAVGSAGTAGSLTFHLRQGLPDAAMGPPAPPGPALTMLGILMILVAVVWTRTRRT